MNLKKSTQSERKKQKKFEVKKSKLFLFRFLKDPKISAVSPSSRFLIARVIRRISFERVRIVLEYGAGDGAMTRAILRRLHPTGRLIAFEPNSAFCQNLKNIQDQRLHVIQDLAENDQEHLNGKLGDVDLVLASLPFSKMKRDRLKFFKNLSQCMTRDASFIIFNQYVPFKLRSDLNIYFQKVEIEMELLNFPPCLNFFATAPLPKT